MASTTSFGQVCFVRGCSNKIKFGDGSSNTSLCCENASCKRYMTMILPSVKKLEEIVSLYKDYLTEFEEMGGEKIQLARKLLNARRASIKNELYLAYLQSVLERVRQEEARFAEITQSVRVIIQSYTCTTEKKAEVLGKRARDLENKEEDLNHSKKQSEKNDKGDMQVSVMKGQES